MVTTNLAKEIRYREQKRLFRKSLLVLQIGTKYKRGVYTDYDTCSPPPSWDENEIIIKWKDATVEDLISLVKGNKEHEL